jgi:hypothetical protein
MHGSGPWWELLARERRRPTRQVGFRYLTANHLVAESIAGPMGREMDVEMRNPAAENIDIDELRMGGRLQGPGNTTKSGAQRTGLLSVKVRDMGHMAFRFEVRKTQDLSLRGDREPPERVLPDLYALKLHVARATATQHARSLSREHVLRSVVAD